MKTDHNYSKQFVSKPYSSNQYSSKQSSAKHSSPKHKRNAGFSLAEILISLVIFSVGSIGIGKLYASMISGTADSKNRFQAATLAEARLESLRFAHKIGNTSALTEQITPKVIDSIAGNSSAFTEKWSVVDLGQGQATIASTVAWQDKSGAYTDQNSVTLSVISSNTQSSLTSIAPPVIIPIAEITECVLVGTSYGSDSPTQNTTGCGSGESYSSSPSYKSEGS